jgi:3-methyladenine DNA glycosylase AlkD
MFPSITTLVNEIEEQVGAASVRTAVALRVLRREYSKRLKTASPAEIVAIGSKLIERRRVHRFIGDELIACRPDALQILGLKELERLGSGMSSWDQVDCFACYLAGPAWREGQISDETIIRWATSKDRWWRRAALVSTVPLNVKARGGIGDTSRTLRICKILIDDRDDMVVKALSWALRALSKRDAKAVKRFLVANDSRLAPRVAREVRQKLTTGRKRSV